jgi:hypothetical protein
MDWCSPCGASDRSGQDTYRAFCCDAARAPANRCWTSRRCRNETGRTLLQAQPRQACAAPQRTGTPDHARRAGCTSLGDERRPKLRNAAFTASLWHTSNVSTSQDEASQGLEASRGLPPHARVAALSMRLAIMRASAGRLRSRSPYVTLMLIFSLSRSVDCAFASIGANTAARAMIATRTRLSVRQRRDHAPCVMYDRRRRPSWAPGTGRFPPVQERSLTNAESRPARGAARQGLPLS